MYAGLATRRYGRAATGTGRAERCAAGPRAPPNFEHHPQGWMERHHTAPGPKGRWSGAGP